MPVGIDESRFTKTELALFRALADGELHARQELLTNCLPDDMGSLVNVNCHISSLRKKLPIGILIVHVSTNGTRGKGFQMVRHFSSNPYDGRT